MIEVEQCSKCGKLKIPDEIEERVKNGEEVEVDVNWSKIGTYASNTLLWETGGLNIDGCRIGVNRENEREYDKESSSGDTGSTKGIFKMGNNQPRCDDWLNQGRWPANVVLDTKSGEMLDRQSGDCGGRWGKRADEDTSENSMFGIGQQGNANKFIGNSGGASRFFYSAKAHKSERNAGLEDLESKDGGSYQFRQDGSLDGQIPEDVKNDIATLKPINLMRWLCRLVTPEDGTVLDTFAGSGTTGCACEIEGFDYILIEKRERFANLIAPKRIEYWKNPDNWDELKEHEEVPNSKELRNGSLDEFTMSRR